MFNVATRIMSSVSRQAYNSLINCHIVCERMCKSACSTVASLPIGTSCATAG